MDFTMISILIGFVGLGMRIEKRFNRIETLLRECPHVDKNKAPLVPPEGLY